MIFVTGATGFLGRHLVPELLAAGYRIRALVRSESDTSWLRTQDVEIVCGDIRDRAAITEAVRGARYVVHAAGKFRFWGARQQFEDNNILGSENISAAAVEAGVERFVYISSVAVAGIPRPDLVIDENYPCRPADAYQWSKLAGEDIVRTRAHSAGLPAIILRPSAFYGAYSHYEFNRIFFEDPLRGIRIQVHHGRHLTFPAYVPDVVQAIIAALDRGNVGETYNVSGESLPHKKVNEIVSRHARIHPFRVNCPAPLMLGLARSWTAFATLTKREPFYPANLAKFVFHDWNVSSAKAIAKLGFIPTLFEEGARATVEWYREIGMAR